MLAPVFAASARDPCEGLQPLVGMHCAFRSLGPASGCLVTYVGGICYIAVSMRNPILYPTASAALDALIAEHFAPQLKVAGFQKQRRTFASRCGGLIRILSFQGSQWSTSEELGYYIRLGIWSEKVAAYRPFEEFGWKLPVAPKSTTWIPAERHWHWNKDIQQVCGDEIRGALSISRDGLSRQSIERLKLGVFDHAVPLLLGMESEAVVLKYVRDDSDNAMSPLYVAALYSVAAPKEFQAFARRLDRSEASDENAHVWRLCLVRMGYRPDKS